MGYKAISITPDALVTASALARNSFTLGGSKTSALFSRYPEKVRLGVLAIPKADLGRPYFLSSEIKQVFELEATL